MRTLLKYVLPVLFAALLSGCGASLARKVRIGEEVAVRQYGTVGLDLTFDVENASRRTLRLEEAELEFFTGAGSLGRAVLRGSVEVPGRSRGPVCSRWKFDFPDAAAAPCRTTLGITALPTPISIELKCTAHLPERR